MFMLHFEPLLGLKYESSGHGFDNLEFKPSEYTPVLLSHKCYSIVLAKKVLKHCPNIFLF